MERSNSSSNIGKIKEKWKYNCSDFTASNSDNNIAPSEASYCVARNVYACSFCKRRFKSAQALGGHMNVHRRERARLRLLPLTINSSAHDNSCSSLHNPINPNPNFVASSILSSPTPFSTKLGPLSSVNNSPSDHHLASTDLRDHKKELTMFDFDRVTVGVMTSAQASRADDGSSDLKGFSLKDDSHSSKAFRKENNIIRLDLEMGLLNDPKAHQDVDLELRLGYF